MHVGLQIKCPLLLSDSNELKFSRKFSKNLQTTYCMKIRPVGAEMFHADGQRDRQTDMTKLAVSFRNFESTPDMHFGTKGYIVNCSG
jgi:hypothetical protein